MIKSKIVDGIVYKCESEKELVDRQILLFNTYPRDMVPRDIKRIDDLCYKYEYVEGDCSCSKDLASILICLPRLWGPTRSVLGVPEYSKYIETKVLELDIRTPSTLNILNTGRFNISEGETTHCDLTYENIIMVEKSPILLDMGMPRGECAIEQDYGKLAQSSVLKWEDVKKGIYGTDSGFKKLCHSNVQVAAMLISHMIRLLSHSERHSQEVLEYVKEKINEYDSNILRYR